MVKHVVAEVDEIAPGERKIVTVEGRSIGIYNVGGSFYAIRNACPHQSAPLCEGKISGFVTSSKPGEYIWTREGEIVRCPWHAWEFDIKTGQSWFDPKKTRVRSYETTVENRCVTGTHQTGGMKEGPYVAEVYAVSIEKQFVCIEV